MKRLFVSGAASHSLSDMNKVMFSAACWCLLSIFTSIGAMAQSDYQLNEVVEFPDRIDMEPSMLEVLYDLTMRDPLNAGEEVAVTMVLQIGPRYSKYFEYSSLQELLFLRSEGYKTTRGRWYAVCDSVGVTRKTGTLYKDRSKGTCREVAFSWGTYSYEEELPRIDWREVPDSVRTIGGYESHLAVCDLRGRQWRCWYAPEIKVSEGPYKLMGLPGLILEAYSEDGEIDLSFVSVSKSEDPIIYNKEGYDRSFKGERKHFYRAISRGKWRTAEVLETSGLEVRELDGSSAKPVRRYMFYVPMELDLVDRPKPDRER